MLTFSWRKVGSSSALALAIVAGLPALAQAQLFPNMYTHRQRTACAAEPPFYGHVRRDYFGYYPTCWRRFPEGWACPCPNPEAPNAAAAFQVRARDPKPDLDPIDPSEMNGRDRPRGGTGVGRDTDPDAMENDQPRGRTGRQADPDPFLPPLPNGRGPLLEPDRAAPTNPGGALTDPATRNGPGLDRPSGRPNPAPSGGSPFEPMAPATGPAPRGSSGPSNSTVPPLDRPSGAASRSEPDEPGTPLLALPEMTPPSSSLPGPGPSLATTMPASLPANGVDIESAEGAVKPAEPAQAPRRTSLLGGLLGGANRRRR